jgi:hypothetical protein
MADGASSSAESGSAEGAAPMGPDEEAKRRFREALDRKRGTAGDKAGDESAGPSEKIHGAHGPAHTSRTFRRKSGG